jgi:hypothetical protein
MHNSGLEIGVRHHRGRGDLWLAYTWSRARREPRSLAGLVTGSDPYQLDQTHLFNAAGSVSLGRWQLGARLSTGTGIAVPFPDPTFAVELRRLPPSFALDLRVDRSWHRRAGTITAYLDVHNATNHRNLEGATTRGLPILPFIGVSFEPR